MNLNRNDLCWCNSGKKYKRCHLEFDEKLQALKDKGRDVEYMLLEDEGHGFSKKENEIAVYQKVLSFLNQFVKSKLKE